MPNSHPDQIKVLYPQMLKDCAGVSHACFGNFCQKIKGEQIALLRSLDTVELYSVV